MKRKSATKTPTQKDDWKGYVNWTPNTLDKSLVVEYMSSEGWDAHLVMDQLVECGYSIAHTYDAKASCVRVAVTGKSVPCPNMGYTLSVRASSVERCVGLVGYYCFVLCQSGDWLVDKVGEEVW